MQRLFKSKISHWIRLTPISLEARISTSVWFATHLITQWSLHLVSNKNCSPWLICTQRCAGLFIPWTPHSKTTSNRHCFNASFTNRKLSKVQRCLITYLRQQRCETAGLKYKRCSAQIRPQACGYGSLWGGCTQLPGDHAHATHRHVFFYFDSANNYWVPTACQLQRWFESCSGPQRACYLISSCHLGAILPPPPGHLAISGDIFVTPGGGAMTVI